MCDFKIQVAFLRTIDSGMPMKEQKAEKNHLIKNYIILTCLLGVGKKATQIGTRQIRTAQ